MQAFQISACNNSKVVSKGINAATEAISYYDKNKLGLDPKESIVESWCASSPKGLPEARCFLSRGK